MNYKNIKVPFLNNETIKNKADLFRKKFWDNSVPVDIEKVIDLKLRINIISIPELKTSCDVDALITSNWQELYVDNQKFLDERYQNRLRFSFAHELGHFILHKNIYNSFCVKNLEDFYKLIEKISQQQYSYIETQANKFANYLLVPRNKLIKERNKIIKENKLYNLKKIDIKTLNSYLAIPISKIFGVSEEVIEIALSDINNKI